MKKMRQMKEYSGENDNVDVGDLTDAEYFCYVTQIIKVCDRVSKNLARLFIFDDVLR